MVYLETSASSELAPWRLFKNRRCSLFGHRRPKIRPGWIGEVPIVAVTNRIYICTQRIVIRLTLHSRTYTITGEAKNVPILCSGPRVSSGTTKSTRCTSSSTETILSHWPPWIAAQMLFFLLIGLWNRQNILMYPRSLNAITFKNCLFKFCGRMPLGKLFFNIGYVCSVCSL